VHGGKDDVSISGLSKFGHIYSIPLLSHLPCMHEEVKKSMEGGGEKREYDTSQVRRKERK
jgi:hypothetical protein